MDIEFVRSRFIKHFDGKEGNIYTSPGRINLIGEHTDYNGGYVFPGAVDKGIMCEIRPNGTNTIMAYAIDLKDRVEFKVDDPQGPRTAPVGACVLDGLPSGAGPGGDGWAPPNWGGAPASVLWDQIFRVRRRSPRASRCRG